MVHHSDSERAPDVSHAGASVPVAIALTGIVLCSVDVLNPVKILCGYAEYWQAWTGVAITEGRIAAVAAVWLFVLCVVHRQRLLYYGLRTFFRCTFNNMFFSSIEMVGMDNLPTHGPVILTGNHNNQFVDGIILLSNSERQLSFMIAQKSFDRPIVGFLARAFHCIPVSRPQDIAFRGAGVATPEADEPTRLRGEGTFFLKQVHAGSHVELVGGKSVRVLEVISDTEMVLEAAPEVQGAVPYKVLPKVDQAQMFNKVYDGLKRGQCLGIFPEGGSHDRTDLLPLKAGVAIIALDAYHKHHMTVPIVPVGLNYFKGHRFGGRVVVEFGPPIVVPETIYGAYESDRHGAVEALLQLIATGMRSVIVPTSDYHMLQQIYMARKLYVPDGLKLSAEQTMDLNRRFAIGLRRVLSCRASGGATPQPLAARNSSSSVGAGTTPADGHVQLEQEDVDFIDQFKAEVEEYMTVLKRLGLKDHHVRQLGWWGVSDLMGRILFLLVMLALGIIPQLLFNLPVMWFASRYAATEQKKALKASKVKVAARDVVMSYKIIYVLGIVPFLYAVYGSLLYIFSPWTATTNNIMLAVVPSFAFLGMKASEQGVRAYADIVPLFHRLLPRMREEQDALPSRRAHLQKKLSQAVKKFGPMLGDLYQQKSVDWAKEMGWYTHAAERAVDAAGAACAEKTQASSSAPSSVTAGSGKSSPVPAAAASLEADERVDGEPAEGEGGLTRRGKGGAQREEGAAD